MIRQIRKRGRTFGCIGLSVFFLLVVVLLLRKEYNIKSDPSENKYNILVSGASVSSRNFYWVDNDRIIFNGSVERANTSEKESIISGIMIWNLKKNEVKPYREEYGERLCYNDNTIFYILEELNDSSGDLHVVFKSGELYLEKTKKLRLNSDSHKHYEFNRFSCEYTKKPEAIGSSHEWESLLSSHGYIEFIDEKNALDFGYRFHSVGGESYDLPFRANSYLPQGIHWQKWKNAYFVSPNIKNSDKIRQWKKTKCLKAYWFFLNGKVKKVCVPFVGPVFSGGNQIKPFKEGYVYALKGSGKDKSGIYVHTGESGEQVKSGVVSRPKVSPGGCRVAFPWARSYEAIGDSEARALSLLSVSLC